MIYPSITDLTQGRYNRYTLVIATAKCARMVTDEYVKQREYAEKLIANKETDKSLISMIKREYRDEKALKNAINRLYNGEFKIMEFDGDEEEAAAAKRFADFTFHSSTMRQAVTYDDVADVVEGDAGLFDDELEDGDYTEPTYDAPDYGTDPDMDDGDYDPFSVLDTDHDDE